MSEEEKIKNPELVALGNVSILSKEPNAMLTEFTNIEIIGRSLLIAFNEEYCHIPATLKFFTELERLRGGLDRKGKEEYLQALANMAPRHIHPSIPVTTEEKEEKRGFLDKLLGK